MIVEPNPRYAGIQPQLLEPACHDRTPMLDVRCQCGADSHVHESQAAGLPYSAVLGVRCPGCARTNAIPLETIQEAFAQMRREGWIK